jgi:hypothetical protein
MGNKNAGKREVKKQPKPKLKNNLVQQRESSSQVTARISSGTPTRD